MAEGFMGRTMATKSVPPPETDLIASLINTHIQKYDFPSKYSLNPALYMEEIEGFPHKWNDRFHPSSDLKTPEMLLFYQKHPVIGPTLHRPVFSASSMVALQLGTALHALFEAVVVEIGLTTKEECEVYFKEETLGISGLCDIRNIVLPDGRQVLVDLKSCSNLPTKLDPLHALQVGIYLDLMEGAPHELGTVLYMEKSFPHRIMDFVVHKKDLEGSLKELYTRWSRVREALAKNDPSSLKSLCSGSPTDKKYESCPIKDYCLLHQPPVVS